MNKKLVRSSKKRVINYLNSNYNKYIFTLNLETFHYETSPFIHLLRHACYVQYDQLFKNYANDPRYSNPA